MITRKISKIAILVLVVASTLLCFTGCGITNYYYDDSDKYKVDDADISDAVENIDIDWVAGNVKVLPHDSDVISFSEKSSKSLSDDMRIHYWLDGATLKIKYCASGRWNLNGLNKELTVMVPKTLTFTEFQFNGISADIRIDDVGAKELDIDTVSGDINLKATVEESVKIDTVSGDTKAEFLGPLNEFKCNAVSGDIDLKAAVKESVKIDTVSGDAKAELLEPLNEFKGNSTSGEIWVKAISISRVEVETVSGEVYVQAQKEIGALDIDTTSGNIKLKLPDNASFKLKFDTTSGSLATDFPHTTKDKTYIFGDGKYEYYIDTVSGDLQIFMNR